MLAKTISRMSVLPLRRAFAKPKKEEAKVVEKIVEVTPMEHMQRLLRSSIPPLSPTQQKVFEHGFQDLSPQEKQMLDETADKILELNTATFYDAVLKKGALGTDEMFYTATQKMNEQELNQVISKMRKEV